MPCFAHAPRENSRHVGTPGPFSEPRHRGDTRASSSLTTALLQDLCSLRSLPKCHHLSRLLPRTQRLKSRAPTARWNLCICFARCPSPPTTTSASGETDVPSALFTVPSLSAKTMARHIAGLQRVTADRTSAFHSSVCTNVHTFWGTPYILSWGTWLLALTRNLPHGCVHTVSVLSFKSGLCQAYRKDTGERERGVYTAENVVQE